MLKLRYFTRFFIIVNFINSTYITLQINYYVLINITPYILVFDLRRIFRGKLRKQEDKKRIWNSLVMRCHLAGISMY